MPHGDFSDIAALGLFAGSMQLFWAPDLTFEPIGTFAVAALNPADKNASLSAVLSILASFFLILSAMLFTVRWNSINGKLSGFMCVGAGVTIARATYFTLDAGVFTPRPLYGYAVLLGLTGLHLMLNANAVIKPAKSEDSKQD
eukprot:TRINITY_DN8709_c0_g1_i2.p1 TRINITY_DN8709_c0_g1~~TRINITY_DN8709_c0_g1_i2.p1  ORF type:complete len:143 (-),score=47.41 TRINITY_DN8709_c0_g1_i2:675-1103(-)